MHSLGCFSFSQVGFFPIRFCLVNKTSLINKFNIKSDQNLIKVQKKTVIKKKKNYDCLQSNGGVVALCLTYSSDGARLLGTDLGPLDCNSVLTGHIQFR